MLVILEGLDATGKSTIARRLHDEHGFEVIHKGPPTLPAVEEYTKSLESYWGNNVHVVCDRWHLGELVYPLSRSRSTDLTLAGFAEIEDFLLSVGAVLVYTLASQELQRSILLNRKEDFDDAQLSLERWLFDRALRKSRLPRLNACLDRTMYEGHRDLFPIIDLATTWEWNAARS